MVTDVVMVMVTAPDPDTAAQLGRTLVDEHLAACANIVPGVRSIYRWQGAVHDDAEVLLIIKTTTTAHETLMQRVLDLHPYNTPEVLVLPVDGGSAAYLRWLTDQVDVSSASEKDA